MAFSYWPPDCLRLLVQPADFWFKSDFWCKAGLAVKFNAPEYAKTSPSEVREVRGRLLPYLPDFIGRGRVENGKTKPKKPHSTIDEMSPVEAAYVTMTVLHQKIYNPDFQLTQDERRAVWVEKHSRTPRSAGNAAPQSSKTVVITPPSPTQRQMINPDPNVQVIGNWQGDNGGGSICGSQMSFNITTGSDGTKKIVR